MIAPPSIISTTAEGCSRESLGIAFLLGELAGGCRTDTARAGILALDTLSEHGRNRLHCRAWR